MFNQTKSRQIEQYNALYESEKKDKNILLLQQQSEVQENRLRQEAFLRKVTLGSIALLMTIIGLLYYVVRTKQRSNRLLKIQRAEIDRKNQSLQQLVVEKEWLVKEIHHRVKNNLHMVVGLLASQAEYLKGQEAYDAITDSQHRVQAMSLIHQKLYNTENLSSIDMPHYVHELADYLQSSFDTGHRFRFVLDIARASFPLSHSIPIGLILNEAITNAMKYAFPDSGKGLITISLKATSETKFCLTIRDDGIGIPENYHQHSSLGISLIEGLATDIRGTLTITNEHGTLITLTFPVADATMIT
jgi:two-component sensor histidine kinase